MKRRKRKATDAAKSVEPTKAEPASPAVTDSVAPNTAVASTSTTTTSTTTSSTTTPAPLSADDKVELAKLEEIVKQGLAKFVEVGNALVEIYNKSLWREGYRSFEDYTRRRWSLGKSHAHRLIDAAKVVNEDLSP